MACNLDSQLQRICLVAFDEGVEARYASLRGNTLVADQEVVRLRNVNGKDTSEFDAEAAATDGEYFYVTGSHSAKRSDCKSNPGSRHVIRFRLDPATGRGTRVAAGADSGALGDYDDTGRLWTLMQSLPELRDYVGERKCLGSEPPPEAPSLAGQQGVNIEGMAVRNKRLYFGFRGPVAQGVAMILSVDAQALFRDGDPQAKVTRVALGERRGIRDMVALTSGFLLLAGPDDSPSSKSAGWTISWWDGVDSGATVTPRVLAMLDIRNVKLRSCDKEIKPEAIVVLEESPRAYRVLILSDGMCDGGPLEFSVPR